MPSKLKRCPFCKKKGWYKNREGISRCRYCHADDAVQVASRRLQKTLDRGHRSLGRDLDRERNK